MPGNRRDDDDRLYPDSKYKGILYEPRRTGASDDDLPVRENRRRARRPGKTVGGFRLLLIKGGASQEAKDAREFGKAARPSHTRSSVNPRPRTRPGVYRSGKKKENERKRAYAYDVRPLGFWGDRIIKTTVAVCAVAAVASSVAIPMAFAKPTVNITINDGGRVLEAPTSAQTVGEFLEDNKVTIAPEDILDVDRDTPIAEGMEIVIRRAMPVTVRTGSESIAVNVVAGTVQDVLNQADVVPAPRDEVYPSLDTYVRPGMQVEHLVVRAEQHEVSHVIPFEQLTVEDGELAAGEMFVSQSGEEGELLITTEQVYKNGVLTSDKEVSERIVKEPVNEITKVGTYVPPQLRGMVVGTSTGTDMITLKDGTPVRYVLEMRTTAYCSACNTGNKTAVGTYPHRGTIAARTNIFKYGTRLYVPGYGEGVVEDTGGFGSGTIDLYMGDRASCNCGSEWGVKYLKVYVLA